MAPDPANFLHWLPHFPWPVADAIFLRGETGYRLHMAVIANLIFPGLVREKESEF